MVAELSSSEITELIAFEWLEPDVGTRIDVGFAAVQALIYNRTRGKNDRPKSGRDFLPKWGPPDHEAMQKQLNQTFGIWREIARLKEQGG